MCSVGDCDEEDSPRGVAELFVRPPSPLDLGKKNVCGSTSGFSHDCSTFDLIPLAESPPKPLSRPSSFSDLIDMMNLAVDAT